MAEPETKGNSILDDWHISSDELSTAIRANPSLRGMVFGYVAELKLRQLFAGDRRISAVRKDDDHDRRKKGDLVVTYKRCEYKIESKSLQTTMIKNLGGGRFAGGVQCDGSDRRDVKLPNGQTVTTTCLQCGEFDILAACLFHYRKSWDFAFALNRDLPRSTFKDYPANSFIKSFIPVPWPLQPPFVADPFVLLEELHVANRVAV